jgi:hypothetical protein
MIDAGKFGTSPVGIVPTVKAAPVDTCLTYCPVPPVDDVSAPVPPLAFASVPLVIWDAAIAIDTLDPAVALPVKSKVNTAEVEALPYVVAAIPVSGRSAVPITRYVGVASAPVNGPARNVFFTCATSVTTKMFASVMTEGATLNRAGIDSPTLVTVP